MAEINYLFLKVVESVETATWGSGATPETRKKFRWLPGQYVDFRPSESTWRVSYDKRSERSGWKPLITHHNIVASAAFRPEVNRFRESLPADQILAIKADCLVVHSSYYELRITSVPPGVGLAEFHKIPNTLSSSESWVDGSALPMEVLLAYKSYLLGREGLVYDESDSAESVKPLGIEPTFFETLKKQRKLKPPTVEKNGFYVQEDIWYLLLRNAQKKVPTVLIGDTGTGKTQLLHRLAKALKKEPVFMNMATLQDATAGLIGTNRLLLSEGAQISKFDISPFAEAVQKPSFIILDEITRCPKAAQNILFSAVDDTKRLPLDEADSAYFENRWIDVHPDCMFFATANIGIEYSGTGVLDRAFSDRFFPVEISFPPDQIEAELLQKAGIPGHVATKIVDVATKLRSLRQKGDLSTTVSVRSTKRIAELIADGLPAKFAFESVLLPLYEGSKEEGDRRQVLNVLTSL